MNTLFYIPLMPEKGTKSRLQSWLEKTYKPNGIFETGPLDDKHLKSCIHTHDQKDITEDVERITELILGNCIAEGAVMDSGRFLMMVSDSSEEGYEVSVVKDDGMLYPSFRIIFKREVVRNEQQRETKN